MVHSRKASKHIRQEVASLVAVTSKLNPSKLEEPGLRDVSGGIKNRRD